VLHANLNQGITAVPAASTAPRTTKSSTSAYFVSSEPLDELLCTWASHRIAGSFVIVHTHLADLKALLARLEAQ